MKRIAVVILAMAALGLSVPAPAQDWGGPGDRFRRGRGHFMGERLLAMLDSDRIKAALGLTDEQTGRLHQIIVDTQKSSVKTRADMAMRGIELRELLRSDKPDREAVMKKVQELSNLRGQMMRQRIEALLEAKTVLTPEQQRKMRAFVGSRRGSGARPPQGRGEPPGGPPPPPAATPEEAPEQ